MPAETGAGTNDGGNVNKDRRTRERIRLFFWAVLTVVCVVAALVARHQQQASLQQKAEAAQQKAVRYTENALVDRLDTDRVSRPIDRSGYDTLLNQVKHDLFTDPRIARVRVWRPDGLLVFTSDDPGQIGKLTSNTEGLRAALGGHVVSVVQTTPFAPDLSTTPKPTELLATYVPLRASDRAQVHGVVEIDDYYGFLREATTAPWRQLQIAFGLVALLCLSLTGLAFVWSRPTEEVTGFGPATPSAPATPRKRELRGAARDTKKVEAAQAEATKLKARVAELEGREKSARADKEKAASAQVAELERLRARVAELEQQPQVTEAASADPAETEALRKRAAELEEQRASAEGRLSQMQSRVTEVEAQMRLTTDQLRSAQQRAEQAEALQAEGTQRFEAAAQVEARLTDELQTTRAELERMRDEYMGTEQAVAEQLQAQRGELDQARARVRMSEEEKERILAEAAKGVPAEPDVAPDAAARIHELEETLRRSETERAMLRAGRPETVYEARNRELEEQLAQVNERLALAEGRARSADASAAGVDPGVIAALEERIAVAELRAEEAERRLDGVSGRSRGSKSRAARSNGSQTPPAAQPGDAGDVDEAGGAGGAGGIQEEEEAPSIDGSELRSRLVRSADARRRGSSSQTPERR
jgi:hypothetical protein